MPGLDYELDPVTGDWVPDGRGGFRTTASNAPAVQHAINDRIGWPGDEKAGSRVSDLRGLTATEAVAEVPDRIRSALAPLIDDGLLRDVIVTTEREGSRVFVRTEVIDSAGSRADVTSLTPFGE